MSSASATETALVPLFDFAKAAIEIKKDPSVDLDDVLAKLATLPPVDLKNPAKQATAIELVTDSLMGAITELPEVFGQIKPPKTRRLLNSTELFHLRAEKIQIDIAEKALKARKTEIHEMISVHLDVVAERQRGIDPETAPKNDKGHYLLASAGNPEVVPVKGGDKHFERRKNKDKVEWSMEKLLDLLESGHITKAEFLSMTSRTRVLDKAKIARLLTLPSKMHRTQEIVNRISTVKYGTLSIHLN